MKVSDNQQERNGWRICVIFAPQSITDSTTTIDSTLHLLEPLTRQIFVITGNLPEGVSGGSTIHLINIKYSDRPLPMFMRILRFIILQLKVSYSLIKVTNKIDIVFLAAGAATLFLPAILAKLLRKRIISLRPGTDSLQRIAEVNYQKTLFGIGKYIFIPIIGILERLNYRLSDKIVVFRSDFTTPALKRYTNKIWFSGSRFYVDVSSFKVEKNLGGRENLIGYIGRFDEVKGVMNFVKAIPLVLRESAGVKVVLGGDGLLRGKIEQEIRDASLSNKVALTGWIPHDELPQYLNRMKLLVIPSYAEAGPHMVFEAMACGTPVLATPVGIIPDVIKDGETGFIMENNSPQCVARNIIRALNHPNLDKIAKDARELIEREYTHEAAVARYRSILASLR